ncbi:MAG: ribonuclease P component 1 family protein [bacterium]
MDPRRESATSRFLRLARGELNGLPVEVLESTDPTLVGVRGLVVDETLNTFLVEREPDQRPIHVAKANSIFSFWDDQAGEPVRIPGDRIRFRPEDRIKKVR